MNGIHASNRLGYTVCGTQEAGQAQAPTELHPFSWEDVTCEACKANEIPARILDAGHRCSSTPPSLTTLRTMYVGMGA